MNSSDKDWKVSKWIETSDVESFFSVKLRKWIGPKTKKCHFPDSSDTIGNWPGTVAAALSNRHIVWGVHVLCIQEALITTGWLLRVFFLKLNYSLPVGTSQPLFQACLVHQNEKQKVPSSNPVRRKIKLFFFLIDAIIKNAAEIDWLMNKSALLFIRSVCWLRALDTAG